MSLPVPLTVRVGDTHITREVESVGFRREAVGGVRSLTFRLRRPIDQMPAILAPFSQVTIYDARTAEPVAQGRLADSGRSADDSGQSWEVVAFGPAQHASDITQPLVYVDRSTEGWWYYKNDNLGPGATWSAGSTPDNGTPGLLSTWSDGTPVPAGVALTAMRYSRIYEAGMRVGYLSYQHRAGVDGGWKLDAVFSTDGNWAVSDTGTFDLFTKGGSTRTHGVVTNFATTRNMLDVRTYWDGGVGSVSGDATWCIVVPVVEALRLDKTGTDITTGYAGWCSAHHIVGDLLGRMLPEFDGAAAAVDTTGIHQINQLVYPDGVTAEQVLADLMGWQPGHRWYTSPDTTGGGYGFRWELWPTTVRYEVTLDDGGSLPISGQTLYNRVVVRWRDDIGLTKTTLRTMACPLLDDVGLVRQALINLGDEAGSVAAAEQAGDTFLAEHNVPKNSGTTTITRPIRDVITGRLVDPWKIEAGELIRVRGVESYPDALNADSADGQSVFRIFAVDYSSDDNAARLELDADPRDTASALAKLMTERTRRR